MLAFGLVRPDNSVMQSIGSYETLTDYWKELHGTFADAPFTEVPRKFYQRQLLRTSGLLAVRLVARGTEPTSLQIRQSDSNNGNSKLTKLDVVHHYGSSDEMTYRGHLLLPRQASEKLRGLDIITIADIPEPTQALFDQGVEILEHK